MQAKKKILIFSTAYYPYVGGAEVAIKEITDRLGTDFEFDLITARFNSELPKIDKVGSVNVHRLGSGNKLDKILLPFRGFVKISELTQKNNYFCFWGMMVTFGSLSGIIFNIVRKLTFKKSVPYILTLQEGDSEAHLNFKWFGLINLSWILSLKNIDILTGISTFLLDRAKKKGYKGKSILVPNGVDMELFSQEVSSEEISKLKSVLQKKEDDIFLVTTGRLTHKNAVDDLITCLTFLPERVSLVVIGKGDLGPNLQKLADNLGVSSRVKFLGFVPYNDLPRYLSVCDIFIRPSRSEGFGNSFIEAMAVGLPVIATPVGGIPDFLEDRVTGLFCNPDNPKSIACGVEEIYENPELKAQIVKNAKKMVTERYDWNEVKVKMKSVFDLIS